MPIKNTNNIAIDTPTADQLSTQAILAYVIPLIISALAMYLGCAAFIEGHNYIEIGYGLHPYLAALFGTLLCSFAVLSYKTFVDIIKGFGEEDEQTGD